RNRPGAGGVAQGERVGRPRADAAGAADGDRRGDVVDGQGERGGGRQAVRVGGGNGHRGRGGGVVGRGVRPAPGAGGVVLRHRAQRGAQRHHVAALGVIEGAGVVGRATLVDGDSRLGAGN